MAKLTVHRADLSQSHQLIPLWLAAFPADSEDYVSRFLNSLPQDTIILTGKCQDEIVTMLFLLPATATFDEQIFSVRYLYAGCTHPQYRGRGFYRQLMSAATKVLQAIGEDAIFLHPADEPLIHMYKHMGYRDGIIGGRGDKETELPLINFINEYVLKRKACMQALSRQTVVWDISPRVMRFFLCDAIAVGAEMHGNETLLELSNSKAVIERLPYNNIDADRDYCLWLPIGDTPLSTLMNKFSGITGMVGD